MHLLNKVLSSKLPCALVLSTPWNTFTNVATNSSIISLQIKQSCGYSGKQIGW